MFSAYGNPICCLPNYLKGFIHALIDLEYFDNKQITSKDRLNNNENQQSKDIRNENNFDALEEANAENNTKGFFIPNYYISSSKSFKLRIKIDTLENLPEGIILDKSTYPKME